ncbi:MAG: hypothetical protein KGY76_04055 [Candidatus Thermoplasmatota archaeon]|nr:hypothetical protein [Candidatus Thermoplasmatota archaeon]
MKIRENDYEEQVQKERRRRKVKMIRHGLGIALMAFFILFVYFTWSEGFTRLVLMVGGGIYLAYVLYSLYKDASAMFALTDELHFEDGEIVKYNPQVSKAKKWIPIENVKKVYFNISDKPNLIFVVYKKEGIELAESFYKQRIQEREEFIEELRERGLFEKESISFEELRDEVE